MKHKIYCPVCRLDFLSTEAPTLKAVIICPICAAMLEIAEITPKAVARRLAQEAGQEIRERVDTYARLKGYLFEESKEEIVQGLIQKQKHYGDFYCPCRFDNLPENICPCLETRMNRVRKTGSCF